MRPGPWQSDWPFRIYQRVEEFGFHSLSQFIDSRPMVSLLALASELGSDVAAIQLESLWLREAEEQGRLSHVLGSLLIRRIRETIPQGWGNGDNFEFHLSRGFSAWGCVADVVLPQAAQTRLWRYLRGLSPEPGWLPVVPHDEMTGRLIGELQRELSQGE